MMKTGGSSIGERIRMMRQAKSLTQEELASRAGLTKGFISQVERNLTSLSVESLLGILDALDQKASGLFRRRVRREDRVRAGRQGNAGEGESESSKYSSRPLRTGLWTLRSSLCAAARRRTRRSRTKAKSSASSCRAGYRRDARPEDLQSAKGGMLLLQGVKKALPH